MGTFAISRITDRVARKLLDLGNVRWSEDELLADYNAIKNMIVDVRRDLGAQTQVVQLVAGAKQALPETGFQFTGAVRNMGLSGEEPGRSLTMVDRDDMDHLVPDWSQATGPEVEHVIADKHDQLIYWVYPAPGTRYIEISFKGALPDADDVADDFALPDTLEQVMFDGIMAMSLAKTSAEGDMGRAMTYWQLMNQQLGLSGNEKIKFNPRPVAQEQASERAG